MGCLMKKLCWLALVLFFTLPLHAVAVTVRNLYQVELPVSSQASDERTEAIKQGLLQVLIRLTGDETLATNASLKPYLQKAGYYVQEYSYQTATVPAKFYVLDVRYDDQAINAMLKELHISFWGKNRPLILVWLAQVSPFREGEIVSDESTNNLQAVLKRNAKKYGLPVIFPVMDVTDMNLVSVNDVLSSSLMALQEAGKRYAPEGILIGKLEEVGDHIESQWQLILAGTQWSWTASDPSAENIIPKIMTNVSTTLSNYYAKQSTTQSNQWLSLAIENINTRGDLIQLIRFLKQLAPVQKVKLSQVSGDVVEINLLIRGAIDSFQQNAMLNQRLNFKSQDPTDHKLIYEWVP